ncbi:MAG: hypothetical protein ACRD0O_14550, partial [Acidimicrobiia bacterium]
ALAGGVAAALLALLVAVPFVTGGRNSTETDQSAAAGEMASGEFLGDVGDLTDPAALRERFAAQRSLALSAQPMSRGGTDTAGAGSGSSSKAATPPLAPGAGTPAAGVPAPAPTAAADSATESYAQNNEQARDEADSGGLDRTVADACARTLAEGPARGSSLLAVATGTYQGTPAVVAVFSDERGAITAYVAARDGCRLLTSYPI